MTWSVLDSDGTVVEDFASREEAEAAAKLLHDAWMMEHRVRLYSTYGNLQLRRYTVAELVADGCKEGILS